MATLVIFCCFTLRPHRTTSKTQDFYTQCSLIFHKIKDGIFALGNATCHYKYLWNRKKQTTPSYSCIALLLPVSFRCLLVHRSSTSCTLCPMFLAPTIPDKMAFSTSGVHHAPMSILWASVCVQYVHFGYTKISTGNHQLFQRYLLSTIPW